KDERGQEITGLLESKAVDSNGDGRFAGAAVSKEAARISATYFHVPVPVSAVKNNWLKFTYTGRTGLRQAEIPLHPDFLNKNKTCRIGFFNVGPRNSWWTAKGTYIIQTADDRGMVIGRVSNTSDEEKLSLIPGSLQIVTGKPFAVGKTDKLIWPGHIYNTATDFDAYEISRLGNLVPLFIANFEWLPLSLWEKYPEITEKMKMKAALAQQGIDNFHKYSVKVILAIPPERCLMPWEVMEKEFPQFLPEKLTREGKFVRAKFNGTIDRANEEAVAFLEREFPSVLKKLFRDVDYADCQGEERLFQPYNYLEYPFYSKAALENYRKYLKNSEAKFPTASTIPETERTFNTPTASKWKNYFAWRTRVHTDFFLTWAKCEWLAFHDNPRYRGAEVEDGAGIVEKNVPHGIDFERLCASPYITLYVAEYPKSSADPHFLEWNKYVRKYKKKMFNLFDAPQLFPDIYQQYQGTAEYTRHIRENMGRIKKTLITFFLSAGVNIDTDGYACCGLSDFNLLTYPSYADRYGGTVENEIWPLWQALIRKYYGYGYISAEEAEKIIKEVETENLSPSPIQGSKKKLTIAARNDILVDGLEKEWAFSPEQLIGHPEQAFLNPGNWKGTEDLSGHFLLGYDRNQLYFAARVKDNQFFPEEKLVLGQYGDEVDLYFSFADPEREILQMGLNCWQLRFCPGKSQVFSRNAAISGSKVVTRRLPDGYFIEGSVPFSFFQFKPKGKKVLLDVSIIDADSEEGAKSNLVWHARCKPWAHPFSWGIGVFE
ncbi:MAG TPA: sugar-binding protein, partial [bacterium]|nr:sugar-binding protein [bacterium]